MSSDPWVWIMGLGMVGIFSFVVAENPWYRFCEHIYVGAAAGYGLTMAYQNLINQFWNPMTQEGKFILFIPFILGLLAYTRFFRGIAWLSRWPMALMAGVGAGLSLYGVTNSNLVAQVRANFLPLNSVNNVIMVVGVLAILIYFFFAIDQKGPVKTVATSGRFLLMAAFGVAFGNVVMGRISLLLGSLQDILGTWLGII
ncbi:MAG: hypothetical protein ACOX2K_08575 [Bacillota bacterium]|jgi:hypothetical protein